MNGSTLTRLPGLSRVLLAAIATGVMFTAGCANMASTAIGSSSMTSAGTLAGRIHGGNQPVAFAAVSLWFVGEGTAATKMATTTSADDGAGSFAFVLGGSGSNGFSCPASPANPLVYVVATGGNTINTHDNNVNNTASVFIAPFGLCSTITTASFVNMTEVTTVATMAALQQYFDPAAGVEAFTTDGTGRAKLAMTNSFSLISNLANLSTGAAVTSTTISSGSITVGYGYDGTLVTATPETSKINLLANILASCINNASSSATACTTLFTNATPPDPATTARPHGTTFAAATDVAQSLYYMLTNPGSGGSTHLTNLYNLSSAAGAPFQPTLGTAPTDWTVGISYSSSSTCNGGSGHLISNARDLAVDTYGNIWIGNNETGGNLSQISATGVPITCIAVGSGATTGITIDSLSPAGSISNVWVADSGSNNVYRYKPGTTPTAITAFPTANHPMAIAADGTGNIYFSSPADTSLYEIPGGVNASAAVTPVAINTSVGPTPSKLMLDNTTSGSLAVWSTSGSSFITRTASTTPDTGAGFAGTPFTAASPSYGISVTAIPVGSTNNLIYVSSDGSSNSLSQFQGTGTTYALNSGWPIAAGTTPLAVASDGAQNVWTIASGSTSLVEVGSNQQTLSPTGTGYTKSSSYLGSGSAVVVDLSGNVWVGLSGANSITEIVGAAVPVYQPYATGLANGNFQLVP